VLSTQRLKIFKGMDELERTRELRRRQLEEGFSLVYFTVAITFVLKQNTYRPHQYLDFRHICGAELD
jgi:hypothetical protein